jgi:hypothetical protein
MEPTGKVTAAQAEDLPRQALLLAGWAGFWLGAEGLLAQAGLAPGQRDLALLAALAGLGAAAALAAGGWTWRLLTSVAFAFLQTLALGAAVLAGALLPGVEVFHSLWFQALLALLAASMLAVTWKRRPYPPSRFGFLLVHVAPSLVLAGGLWGRSSPWQGPGRWLSRAGFAALLLGAAWMFYLKPVLKRRETGPEAPAKATPAWLGWTRAAFLGVALLLGAAQGRGFWTVPATLALAGLLLLAAALHLYRVPAYKARGARLAALGAWGALLLLALLTWRLTQ